MSKDRKHEAFEMLIRYHANGDFDSPIMRDEYNKIYNSISAEADIKSASR